VANLGQGSWQLDVVGDMTVAPQYVRRLKDQASAAGIAPYIQWHGRLADRDLTDLLASSQLLVVPSSYEGFGIVYLEAMGYGLPAIASTGGAAHEIITDGVHGFLIPPADVLTLTSRLQTVSKNRDLLARQSLAAFDRAVEHPTWTTSMSRVRRFLLSMAT
jgi:glycosyltransferase involved in cell wall biosynthesis